MAATQVEGYVCVYESSDGGTGDPAKTFWQFFVGAQPVTTANHYLAETMRLAVETNSKVKVTYDPAAGNTISQARIAFKYVCAKRKIDPCDPNIPGTPREVCETLRYSPCVPQQGDLCQKAEVAEKPKKARSK
jgi:hypothetical protein